MQLFLLVTVVMATLGAALATSAALLHLAVRLMARFR